MCFLAGPHQNAGLCVRGPHICGWQRLGSPSQSWICPCVLIDSLSKNVTSGTEQTQKEEPMTERNFARCGKLHTLNWLFFLGYVPFLKLRLVLKLSHIQQWNAFWLFLPSAHMIQPDPATCILIKQTFNCVVIFHVHCALHNMVLFNRSGASVGTI